MKLTSKLLSRILLGLFSVICLAILVGAYEANNILQTRANALSILEGKNKELNDQQTQMQINRNNLKKYDQLNIIAQSIVPQDKNSDIVTRQIINLASSANIPTGSMSITFPSSNLGSNTTATSPNSSTNKLSQLSKVPGISGVYDLPITVSIGQDTTVSYKNFLQFLSAIQQNRRTANVSSVSITPSSQNSNNVSFTLIIDEYIKPWKINSTN